MAHMRTIPGLLADLQREGSRPRITMYDDTHGPTAPERIELSARVLDNWVAKAANLLVEDLDIGPQDSVLLDLPPHWRAAYWALAAWSVGARVVPGADLEGADLLVTGNADRSARSGARERVLVTLPALARSGDQVPAGVVDEARVLLTYGDVFSGSEPTAYPSWAPVPHWERGTRVHTATPDLAEFLKVCLHAWAVDGSVVLSRGQAEASVIERRCAAEGVTLAIG